VSLPTKNQLSNLLYLFRNTEYHCVFHKKKLVCNSILSYALFFIIIIAPSCSNPYKSLPKTELQPGQIKEVPYALPFSENAFIYKTDMTFYKNEISGLLIIKKTDENIYRIALTTQFGLKIFDFELNNGKLKVEYCVEYLNKSLILKTFESDFNLLLLQNRFDKLLVIENPETKQKIWQFIDGKYNYNYIENVNSASIENIYLKKRNSEKIRVGLDNHKNDIPGNILLEHQNIKLKMNLKRIQ